MNTNIRKLHRIASKKSRFIIGLMSGTSMDGLDIALCKITGSGRDTAVQVLRFETVVYNRPTKEKILKIFARQQIAFHDLCELNAWIALLHARMILACLSKWKVRAGSVDAIASHGQTVFHAPKRTTPNASINSTLQIGDGDHLAVATGIITLSDFRQKHIAAGGEGAPLAMYGDYLLFSKKGEERVLLNIGGIGNFTYLPASGRPSNVIVTDTGPGNTLLDQVVQKFIPGKFYDADSQIAMKGTVHKKLLQALKLHPFFRQPFPKTTGPEVFNMEYVDTALAKAKVEAIGLADLLATLTRFSAETIAEAILKLNLTRKISLLVSGGGAHNPLLIQWITELVPRATVSKIDTIGISGDAKEAVLFAVLANESLAGGRVHFGNRTNVPTVSMGKVSFPA